MELLGLLFLLGGLAILRALQEVAANLLKEAPWSDHPTGTEGKRRGSRGATDQNWAYFERSSGHRFIGAPGEWQFCARCGTSLEDWQYRQIDLIRSVCPGPYREPWWLRVLRWIARRLDP